MQTIKSKLKNEASAPANVRPSSVSKHNANRKLPTQKVLDFLKAQLPQHYQIAEIVGKWIWLDMPDDSNRVITKKLWHLGFHRNERRGVWQHPCGTFVPYAPHPTDPRTKYGSHFAVNLKTA